MTISKEYKEVAEHLLKEAGLSVFIPLTFTQLAGDGSPRQFYRLSSEASTDTLILVIPAKPETAELLESRSAWLIGKHLENCNVPVPKPYSWDEDTGILLFEDLGDYRLQDIAQSEKGSALYREVVTSLAHMQCVSISGFNEAWCWDSPVYDKQLMLERESGYFLRAFWQDFLEQKKPAHLNEEFEALATELADVSTEFFLHRDFQSRNVMVKDNKPRFIDFQGGRKGPVGYDLASLVNDPYTSLSYDFREELVDIYWNELQQFTNLARDQFQKQYTLLACQRNLQILGAFAFLSSVRKKHFFADFISPAIHNLSHLTTSEHLTDFKVLKNTVQKAVSLLE